LEGIGWMRVVWFCWQREFWKRWSSWFEEWRSGVGGLVQRLCSVGPGGSKRGDGYGGEGERGGGIFLGGFESWAGREVGGGFFLGGGMRVEGLQMAPGFF